MSDLSYAIQTARCIHCGKLIGLSGHVILAPGEGVREAWHDECAAEGGA